jgi:hypothetical protein
VFFGRVVKEPTGFFHNSIISCVKERSMFNTEENVLQYLKGFFKRYYFLKCCYLWLTNFFRRLYFFLSRKIKKIQKLHLGCGDTYLNGYINIDVSPYSAADMVFDIRNLGNFFQKNTISEVLMIHALGYLRLFDAQYLLSICLDILIPGGKLIIEFPDIIKCSKMIINNCGTVEKGDLFQYIEGIRGFYAFDLDQIKYKVQFTPYTFGWSANHMKYELTHLGFKQISILDGNAHERPQRDTRVEATK